MARRSSSSSQRRSSSSTVFARRNYVLLLVGIALVVIGFAAMRIDNQLESVVSLYLAPLLILGGYLEVIYAVLRRPSSDEEGSDGA
ncbi:MAG: DUF3098 domain-containing protein [Bacteroidetes bacterium QS_1_65_9]|nr:MAG: DUF3098 domain-containing protein [Bacteroidetes bacterium QS_1_65_9]